MFILHYKDDLIKLLVVFKKYNLNKCTNKNGTRTHSIFSKLLSSRRRLGWRILIPTGKRFFSSITYFSEVFGASNSMRLLDKLEELLIFKEALL